MKKGIIVGGLVVITSLLFTAGNYAFAEEGSPNEDNATIISSILETTETETTETAETTGTIETTVPEIEKDGMSLREAVLYFEIVPKELVDQLTDEQIQEMDELARNTFGAQSITLLGRLLVKVYGPNPIPAEAYLTDYSKMSPEEFKTHLPQIRLSLIHVFDVDEQKVAAISDTELLSLIDEVTSDSSYSSYWIAGLEAKISGRETSIGESSSTETTASSLNSSEMDKQQSTDEQSANEKKKGFPITGETIRTSFIVVGVLVVIAAGIILYKRKKK
ncbi:LPXTG cell wall anchor domain-containing protein [uncultured Enterococcus sp.]|uniref:LPXTG cell wall anchor domain-containing protein n=1 Tax=uncultured Enterococcus sp. TaxID=167972 RepID=UPI002AA6432B|nr:LPXTG cell wall anchor domain-containing protein [uncultured Enterococcus sp.]